MEILLDFYLAHCTVKVVKWYYGSCGQQLRHVDVLNQKFFGPLAEFLRKSKSNQRTNARTQALNNVSLKIITIIIQEDFVLN